MSISKFVILFPDKSQKKPKNFRRMEGGRASQDSGVFLKILFSGGYIGYTFLHDSN